jgi:hypothetical protein
MIRRKLSLEKSVMRDAFVACLVLILTVLTSAASGQQAPQAAPLMTLSGDGLTMIVRTLSPDGLLSGDIQHGEAVYPFTATLSRAGDTETAKGTFTVGGQAFAFETRQRDGDAKVTFTTGGQMYMLAPPAANPLAAKPAPANPLGAGPGSEPAISPATAPPPEPLTDAVMTLVGDGLTVWVLTLDEDSGDLSGELSLDGKTHEFSGRISYDDNDMEVVRGTYGAGIAFATSQGEEDEFITFSAGGRKYRLREGQAERMAAPAKARTSSGPLTTGPAGAALGQVQMHKTEFKDITMGGVVAYTMLVPAGWKPEGHIEWSQAKTPYPQCHIKVTGPDDSRVAFHPAMTFSYSEATDSARQGFRDMGMPERQGMPPPNDMGQWIAENAFQNAQGVSGVRLVRSVRDQETERMLAAQRQASGVPTVGTWEAYIVTVAYDLNGVPFTEEFGLTYSRLEPVPTQHMVMYNWMLFVNSDVRAPSAMFEQARPVLYASSQSLSAVPQWWTLQQQIIMETTRRNHVIGMDEIRRRGEQYGKMSDESMAAWRQSNAVSDRAQQDRINAIYEVTEVTDVDGSRVRVPIHYRDCYSDGKGNFWMTNGGAPEGGDWKLLEPAR